MSFIINDAEEYPPIYFGGGGPESVQFIVGANGILHPSATFTRASTGATELTQGVYSVAAVNEPRYQYQGGRRGLLIEPAATNVLTYSQDFNNAAWSKSGATPSDSPSPSPSGGVAQRISFAAAGSSVYRGQAVLTTGAPWTGSIYLRSDTPGTITLKGSAGTSPVRVSVTATWKKFSVTYTPATTSDALTIERTLLSDLASVDAWQGGQEAGSIATSTIITGASAATRAPDIPSITTASFSFNQAEGAFVCEYVPFGNDGLLANTDASLGKYIGLGVQGSATGGFATPSGGPNSNVGSINKLAASYTSGGYFYASRNAASAVGIANCDYTGSATLLNIGTRNRVTPLIIFSMPYYPRKYTAAELQAAST